CYRVRASNSAGDSGYSNYACVTSQNATQLPGLFNLSANAYCNTTAQPAAPAVKLTWSPSTGVTTYSVYRNGSYYLGPYGSTQLKIGRASSRETVKTYAYVVLAKSTSGARDSNANI